MSRRDITPSLARVDSYFETAKELFNSVVTIPLGSDASEELCRYFQIRKAWDLHDHNSVTDADLIFRNQAKARFVGQRFQHLYRGWKAGRVTQDDIRQEFGGASHPVTAHFETELLRRVAAEREREGMRRRRQELRPTPAAARVSSLRATGNLSQREGIESAMPTKVTVEKD